MEIFPPPENPMTADRIRWNIFKECLYNVIEMYLKQREDLECTEEHYREY